MTTPRTLPGPVETIGGCRVCGTRDLVEVLDFGPLPHADGFVAVERAAEPDLVYPTTVVACPSCSLLQLREDVAPSALFDASYVYRSSVSPTLVAHGAALVDHHVDAGHLGPDGLILEIASNDGYLLQRAVDRGVPALGIEPVRHLADEARARGVRTVEAFFDRTLARELADEGIRPDVLVANNVLAHVPDLHDVVSGLALLMGPRSVASIEVPYVLDLLDGLAFDTIYHQHRAYFSVQALLALVAPHGLHVNRVEAVALHGGSIRLTVTRRPGGDGSPDRYVQAERERGLPDPSVYLGFAGRVRRVVEHLRGTVAAEVETHGPLVAYGAAAKGTVTLNVAGLGTDQIAYVVDRNTVKHGRLVPGVRVPIEPVERLEREVPPVTLLLAWNFRDEIVAQQAAYLAAGGRFLLPVTETSRA